MKSLFFTVIFSLSATILFADNFCLLRGDLLFQADKGSGLSEAIAEVTTGKDNINYTHVGIVTIENDSVFVIEATTPVVCKTPIDSFLNRSATIEGHPPVAVGRLKPQYRELIPQAIINAEKYVGKSYDYVYDSGNDDYYCSELVYVSFLDKEGKPIFESQSMTFLNAEGNTSDYWIAHFKRYGAEIPEGREGTNPGDLSKSDKIEIVYLF